MVGPFSRKSFIDMSQDIIFRIQNCNKIFLHARLPKAKSSKHLSAAVQKNTRRGCSCKFDCVSLLSKAILASAPFWQLHRMAASSSLLSCLQKDLEDACTAICSIVATTSSSSITHTAVALQRNRDLHSLLQRLLNLYSQLAIIVRKKLVSDGVTQPHSRMSSKH
jgi:hypothetical protein